MAEKGKADDATSRMGKRRVAAKKDNREYYSEKKKAITAAAAGLFKEKGVAGTSLDDVAILAGTDRSTLYYYFSNKSEIFHEIVAEAIEAQARKAEELRDSKGSAEEKLRLYSLALMKSYADNYPNLYVFLQENYSTLASSKVSQRDRLIGLTTRVELAVKQIISDGQDNGEFRTNVPLTLAAYAAFGMINWTHRWFKPDGPLSAEEVGSNFADILIAGLKA